MKQIKKGAVILFVLAVFSFGFYAAYNMFGKNHFIPQTTAISAGYEAATKKLKLEEAIIESFQSKRELITFEVELSDVAEWDDSWGTLDIFHKSQRIRFYGTGLYTTDLYMVTSDDIQTDTERKVVTVTMPKPAVKSVTIDEDKTEYENPEKGWLRFGGISLTPEQYNAMYSRVKENMRSKLESTDFYSKAEKNAEAGVKEIFQLIADTLDAGYTVQIKWKSL